MSRRAPALDDPRIVPAVEELKALITSHYPDARFDVSEGDDPEGIHLTAIIDIEDPDEVTDLVIDRTMHLQIEEQLPIYVMPVRARRYVIGVATSPT